MLRPEIGAPARPAVGCAPFREHGSRSEGVRASRVRHRQVRSWPSCLPVESRGRFQPRGGGAAGFPRRPTTHGGSSTLVAVDLDYLAFDADNHYYEALHAFTRHLDP